MAETDRVYVSLVSEGECRLCGVRRDLRVGVCIRCSPFIAGELVGEDTHALWDMRKPRGGANLWYVRVPGTEPKIDPESIPMHAIGAKLGELLAAGIDVDTLPGSLSARELMKLTPEGAMELGARRVAATGRSFLGRLRSRRAGLN